ncbi:MAG TPA: MarR family transcriptional regulator [Gaiellaceae bacterium]|nr:MarR family transcriptional regulator [Gaiellaceae bacterium]
MTQVAEREDSIDRMVARWAPHLPAIDLEVETIVQRVQKLQRYVRKRMDETLNDVGLSWSEWEVLGHLRLAGEPYRSSPGQLAKHGQLSSGAMTARLDRLEEREYIRRLPDPDDRRGVLVELTEAGLEAYFAAVDVQAAKEAAIAHALTKQERAELNGLLRKLILGFEEPGDTPKDC